MSVSENDIPTSLIAAFPPSADGLLGLVGGLVTDEMLDEISRADYGMDADAHLEQLGVIRDSIRVPDPFEWHPKEVLELIRWSRPDDPEWRPGSTGRRGHIMRAFSCAALLRTPAVPPNYDCLWGDNQTLAQLIESALILGDGLPEALASFLTWRFPLLSLTEEERPFFAFGVILLALLISFEKFSPAEVEEMVAFVMQAESSVRDPTGACTAEMFTGSFFTNAGFNQCHHVWRSLAARLLSRFAGIPSIVALIRKIEMQ